MDQHREHYIVNIESSQTSKQQKSKYCIIPLPGCIYSSQTHRCREKDAIFQELVWGEKGSDVEYTVSVMEDEHTPENCFMMLCQ